MEYYRLASRVNGETNSEKCPQCKFIARNHIVLSDDLWVCGDCGCAFMPKVRRLSLRNDLQEEQKRQIKAAQEEKKAAPALTETAPESTNGPAATLTCPECGFEAKNRRGLDMHRERKHGAGK